MAGIGNVTINHFPYNSESFRLDPARYADPDQPSFMSIAYKKILPKLELVLDAWEGKNAWASNPTKATKYLRRGEAEPLVSYNRRVATSLYRNTFKKTVQRFSGLLSEYTTDELVPSLEEWLDDIDGRGNTLEVFMRDCDTNALRDGFVGIHVDYPTTQDPDDPATFIDSRAKEIRAASDPNTPIRPLLKMYERINVIRASGKYQGGKWNLDHVALREVDVVPDGQYGEKERVLYRLLYTDRFELWEEETDSKNQTTYTLLTKNINSLGEIPFVFYLAEGIDFAQVEPVFYELAETNFSRYDLYSDYREVMRKCNLPVPVRQGFIDRYDGPGPLPPLVLGHSTALDIFADGNFFFAEPTGSAIAATKEEIKSLDAQMLEDGLNFLTGDTSASNRTATEVELQSTQTKATLRGMAIQKQSAMEMAFYYWALWTGEAGGGKVDVNKEILDAAIEPAAVALVFQGITEGVISRELGLEMLYKRGFFPKDTDIEAEIAKSLEPQALTVATALKEMEPDEQEDTNDGGSSD